MEDEFSLDEARETLFTLQRACERHTAALGKVVDGLNSKHPEDEWLLEVLDEASKGVTFHQQHLALFAAFHARASAYVEAVRNEAHQLAMQELSGSTQGDGHDAGSAPVDTGIDAESAPGAVSASAKSGQRRKSSKTVHPELLKFKLEKQAKILGKYGGIPALGAGLVLPRLQRESILKATGSPAAREIHYSKVENKDASNLAEVMRFKVRKSEEGGGGATAASPWQAELSAKKGRTALDGTDEKDQVTPSTRSHAVYGEELGGILQQRQAALEGALLAHRSAPVEPVGAHISGDALDELAEKLRRRQAAAEKMAAEAAAAEAEALEAAAPPQTPSWCNASAPFGSELAAALQRRAEEQRGVPATEEAGAPHAGANTTPVPSHGRPSAPSPAPGLGLTTPATAPRRSAPPGPLSVPMMTPPGLGASNELQEKLRRRLSALDNPIAASEAQ